MPYMIDGHNLIPKVAGMSLRDLDDEQQLVELLQRYCSARRQKAEVFFDQAPIGQAGSRQVGLVKVYFVSRSTSADEAIRRRLEQTGRQAHNWKVVSSDRQVQAEARSHGAEVISSEVFAGQLREDRESAQGDDQARDKTPSPEEVEDWLRQFTRGKKK